MAFTSILRKSLSCLVPSTARIIRTQRNHHASLFTAINQATRATLSPNTVITGWCSPYAQRFSSSVATKKSDLDEALLKVLQSEIKWAEESPDHNMVHEIPSELPFQIEDSPGKQTVTLRGSYEDEKVTVEVHMPALVTGEDDGRERDGNDESENPSQSSIPLVVTIFKKSGEGPYLEFGVTAYPDEIVIDSLSVKNTGAEEEIAYEGPDFGDLDENLQKALHKYLAIRGIKPRITNFLHEYMINKESKEYLLWLTKVKAFIEA